MRVGTSPLAFLACLLPCSSQPYLRKGSKEIAWHCIACTTVLTAVHTIAITTSHSKSNTQGASPECNCFALLLECSNAQRFDRGPRCCRAPHVCLGSCTAHTFQPAMTTFFFPCSLASGVMSRSRSRSPVRRDEPMDEPMSEDFKAFVGGISWHISDRELKDSELPPQPVSHSLYPFMCRACWQHF